MTLGPNLIVSADDSNFASSIGNWISVPTLGGPYFYWTATAGGNAKLKQAIIPEVEIMGELEKTYFNPPGKSKIYLMACTAFVPPLPAECEVGIRLTGSPTTELKATAAHTSVDSWQYLSKQIKIPLDFDNNNRKLELFAINLPSSWEILFNGISIKQIIKMIQYLPVIGVG